MKKCWFFVIFLALTSIGFAVNPAINSFNTGYLSPLMEARADFGAQSGTYHSKYSSACRILENMLVISQGPAAKRPGTKYIATVKSGAPKLLSFDYATDDTYAMETGNLYMRFYRDGGQILVSEEDPNVYEIATPFLEADLLNIQTTQADNIMYLVDGTNPPQKLTRSGHASWTIEDAPIETGPFQAENITTTTITPSGTLTVDGTVTLTASASIFKTGHVGSIWEINQQRGSSVLSGSLSSDTNSANSGSFTGPYSFTTSATWKAIVTLERSTDDGATWEAALSSLNSINFDNPAENEVDTVIHRVTMSERISGTCNYVHTITDKLNHGIVRITSYTSDTEVIGTVLTALATTDATTRWREGYWSDYRGWPKTVEIDKQRLIFGGSDTFNQTLWFGKSDPDDYENFAEGTLDTSSFTVALEGQNPITWLLGGDYLFIGTSGSCGRYGGYGKAHTPLGEEKYREQTPNGAYNIEAVTAGNAILYIERGARKIREFGFSLQHDKYVSTDLTQLAEDITEGGIVDAAFQARPDPILWCVLDGDIATMTYQREQAVVAWSLQTTDGDFESVAVIPSDDEDEVWVIVNRDNGRYIEQFQPRNWGSDDDDAWFSDSGISYSGDPNTSFSGATHLANESVVVFADGIIQPNVTVSSTGTLTLGKAASNVIVGMAYTSKLETMPIVIDPQDSAYNKKIKSLNLDFYKTGTCSYGNGPDSELTKINFFSEPGVTATQELYTSTRSYKNVPWMYGPTKKQTVYLETSEPSPMMIRKIIPEFLITR